MAVDSIETLFSKSVSHHKSRYIFRVTANKDFVQGCANAVYFGAEVFRFAALYPATSIFR